MAALTRCDICSTEIAQPTTRGFRIERAGELSLWGQVREWDACSPVCLAALGESLIEAPKTAQGSSGPHLHLEARQ